MDMQPAPSSIADLSYRNYDGPIHGQGPRWWVVARTMIEKSFRMRSLWVFALLSSWYFVVMIVILFFLQQVGSSNPGGAQALQAFLGRIVWKDQFFHGFGFSQHLILVVTLLVGAGTIANDNRSNALLVYLSKPCRKIDYLIGKWLGVFVPILVVITLPTVAFYVYGMFSFRQEGFFSADPWLILRVLALLPLAAAIHSSLIVMVSSLFRQGTIAGAVYAGIYFMGYFFTLLMQVLWFMGRGHVSSVIVNLNYCSIDGLQIGLARAILHPSGSRPFGLPQLSISPLPPPSLVPYLGLVVLIVAGCLWFTWTRIRAVEVV